MIEQQGRVLSTDGDLALIRVGTTSGCAACDAGRGCGAGLFARLLNRRAIEITVQNALGLTPGTGVMLAIPERLFLGLAVRLYGLPLAAGLLGAVLGHQVMAGFEASRIIMDAATLAGSILAAVIAFRLGVAGLDQNVKPNTAPGGLYSEIRMLEVKT